MSAVIADPEFDGGFVVGCSGGADSSALALGAQVAASMRGVPVSAVIVDHGLQEGSSDVAQAVRSRLVERGLDARVARVEVAVGGAGLEAAARDARLAALAEPGLPVLLGHTLDDQAEQVLLGLARGSGTRSLAGIPPRRGRFYRPLLGLRRSMTEQACAEWGIDVWTDPHNSDVSLTRARVRARVLPLLEAELGPGLAEALARTADLARADADALDALAPPAGDAPSTLWLAGLDPALRGRVLKSWLVDQGATDITAGHVAAVDRLVTAWRGQRGVDVPGGRVRRQDGRLRWHPTHR